MAAAPRLEIKAYVLSERDHLARDIFVAGAENMRWTPSEAYSWADAFLAEREKQRPAKDGASVDARLDGDKREIRGTGFRAQAYADQLDEAVIGDWLHVEATSSRSYFVTLAGRCFWVHVENGVARITMEETRDYPIVRSSKPQSVEDDRAAPAESAPPMSAEPIGVGPTIYVPAPTDGPRWGTADGQSWCLWWPDSSESACRDNVCDEPVTWWEGGVEPPPEDATCDGCRAWREAGDRLISDPPPVQVMRMSTPAEEPPTVDKLKAPRRRHWCCAPSCSAPGKTAKNASGAKVAKGGYLCAEHMRFAETDPALVRAWMGTKAQTVMAGVANG